MPEQREVTMREYCHAPNASTRSRLRHDGAARDVTTVYGTLTFNLSLLLPRRWRPPHHRAEYKLGPNSTPLDSCTGPRRPSTRHRTIWTKRRCICQGTNHRHWGRHIKRKIGLRRGTPVRLASKPPPVSPPRTLGFLRLHCCKPPKYRGKQAA
jgi:hypothetical protein